MGFSRKEHWSGSHSLLQGIFLNQRLNLGFPHCRQILYQLSHQGSPWWECTRLIRPLDPKGAREGARLPWPASFSKNNSCSTFFFFDVQFSSVTQLCPTLCDSMNRSTPGLPVHHQLPEFTQTHVHRVSDAIQPSHPLSSPSPAAPNPSQHQSLFQ